MAHNQNNDRVLGLFKQGGKLKGTAGGGGKLVGSLAVWKQQHAAKPQHVGRDDSDASNAGRGGAALPRQQKLHAAPRLRSGASHIQQQQESATAPAQCTHAGGSSKPAGASAQPQPPAGPQAILGVDKLVVNCLGCGKIFDLRNQQHPDTLKLLERKGLCTFCGRPISRSAARGDAPPAPPDTQPPADVDKVATTAAAVHAGDAAAQAAAVAFKDRLVQYNNERCWRVFAALAHLPGLQRHAACTRSPTCVGTPPEHTMCSARRTAVIDDQSDYFEVDSNAWLTDEEKQRLRERQRLEQAADQARRGAARLALTLDLLGRRVLVADPVQAALAAQAGGGSSVSFRTGDDALVPDYQGPSKTGNTSIWQQEAAKPGAGAAAAAAAASSAAAGSSGGGGRVGAPAQQQQQQQEEALASAMRELRTMRAGVNPSVKPGKAPKFVRPAVGTAGATRPHAHSQTHHHPQLQQQQQHQGGAAAAAAAGSKEAAQRAGGRAAGRSVVGPDLGGEMEEFEAFALQVRTWCLCVWRFTPVGTPRRSQSPAAGCIRLWHG